MPLTRPPRRSPAASDACHTVKFAHHDEFCIITAGKLNMRVWTFDLANRKVRPADCNLGKLQRTINTVYIDHNDEYVYAGA